MNSRIQAYIRTPHEHFLNIDRERAILYHGDVINYYSQFSRTDLKINLYIYIKKKQTFNKT